MQTTNTDASAVPVIIITPMHCLWETANQMPRPINSMPVTPNPMIIDLYTHWETAQLMRLPDKLKFVTVWNFANAMAVVIDSPPKIMTTTIVVMEDSSPSPAREGERIRQTENTGTYMYRMLVDNDIASLSG